MAQLIDGKKLAAEIRAECAEAAAQLKSKHSVTPCLAAVLVGEDPASQVYVRNKERACEKAGIASQAHRIPAETTEQELLDLVESLNADSSVHGILVQLPLPGHISTERILRTILPEKDVDAFHPENVGLMSQGQPRFLPCTPHGVLQMLRRCKIETAGKQAVVIGRSDIVGKPLAMMLAQRGWDATVTQAHSRTADLQAVCQSADILIAAVGKPKFVPGDWIRPGATVIDVGINRTDDGLVGDVNFDEASKHAAWITPVPGGVGPMTIAMLLHNTVTAAELQTQ